MIPGPLPHPNTNDEAIEPNPLIGDFAYIRVCVEVHRNGDAWPVAFSPSRDGVVV